MNAAGTNGPAQSQLQVPSSGAHTQQKTSSDKMAAARKNVFKTLLTVTVCFIVCWIWNSVYVLAYLTGANIKMAGRLYVLTVYAAFTNCIINPFIYCIQYKPLQKQVLKLIGSRSSMNTNTIQTESIIKSNAWMPLVTNETAQRLEFWPINWNEGVNICDFTKHFFLGGGGVWSPSYGCSSNLPFVDW